MHGEFLNLTTSIIRLSGICLSYVCIVDAQQYIHQSLIMTFKIYIELKRRFSDDNKLTTN